MGIRLRTGEQRKAVDLRADGLLRFLPYALTSHDSGAWDTGTTGVRGWMRACRGHRSPPPASRATKEEREVMIGTILMALVAGAIVGPLARLVLPGRQNMGVLLTVVLGAVGSLIGAFIYYKATGVSDTKGIDWISGLIGVVVAAALIVGYGMVTGNRQTR